VEIFGDAVHVAFCETCVPAGLVTLKYGYAVIFGFVHRLHLYDLLWVYVVGEMGCSAFVL
jgi:hypothetical protein